jgi:hypothetical protein
MAMAPTGSQQSGSIIENRLCGSKEYDKSDKQNAAQIP